jgi:hypothetical protein
MTLCKRDNLVVSYATSKNMYQQHVVAEDRHQSNGKRYLGTFGMEGVFAHGALVKGHLNHHAFATIGNTIIYNTGDKYNISHLVRSHTGWKHMGHSESMTSPLPVGLALLLLLALVSLVRSTTASLPQI